MARLDRAASGRGGCGDDIVRTARDARLRSWCDVTASIVAVIAEERPIRLLDVVVDDGTGRLCCRFFGRTSIPGISCGCRLRVTGRMALHIGRQCLLNPAYELLDDACGTSQVSS